MALVKCSECGKEISTTAPACVHCGAPATAARPAAAARPPDKVAAIAKGVAVAVIFIGAFFVFVDSPKKAATAAAPIDKAALVTSCVWKDMERQIGPVFAMSWVDQAAVCEEMHTSLGHYPTVGTLQNLLEAIVLINSQGGSSTARETAFQMMNIVEARGQTAPEAINETVESVWKISGSTHGRVLPREINYAVRQRGLAAQKLTQEDIFYIGAVLWEQKKAGQ